jgi:hypothetical protein
MGQGHEISLGEPTKGQLTRDPQITIHMPQNFTSVRLQQLNIIQFKPIQFKGQNTNKEGRCGLRNACSRQKIEITKLKFRRVIKKQMCN